MAKKDTDLEMQEENDKLNAEQQNSASDPVDSQETVENPKPTSFIGRLLFNRCIPLKMRPWWEHPAGPQTIFFWAPLFKWGLVLAGIGDLGRLASQISIIQATSLMLTGLIWSRYSLVIIPKNWSLFCVNILVGLTQLVQLVRAIVYQLQDNSSNDFNITTTEVPSTTIYVLSTANSSNYF